MVKIIILVLLALVLLSLGAAMFSLVRERGDSSRTAKFLTLRIALSIALFVFVGFAFFMGWIQPHGIVPPKP
jgi:predicted Kef-type K+ transport protein